MHFVQCAKYTENDMKQIRSTLALQFNEVLLKKDREYQERMKEVEEEAAERVKEVSLGRRGWNSRAVYIFLFIPLIFPFSFSFSSLFLISKKWFIAGKTVKNKNKLEAEVKQCYTEINI